MKTNVKADFPKGISKLTTCSVEDLVLEDEEVILEKEIIGGELCSEYNHLYFRRTKWRNVSFKDAVFIKLDLEDAYFENCDFSGTDMRGVSMLRCHFKDCKMMGANLSDSTLQNVIFEDVSVVYGNCKFSSFEKVILKKTKADYSDFQSSKLSKVILDNVGLRGTQFSGTSLKDINFSSCDVEGMGFRHEDIQGAIISAEQSPLLIKMFGIVVEE